MFTQEQENINSHELQNFRVKTYTSNCYSAMALTKVNVSLQT